MQTWACCFKGRGEEKVGVGLRVHTTTTKGMAFAPRLCLALPAWL